MEINELSDDFDINVEAVNAKERMGGVLNTIDSLAKEDILRWVEIEKLPI
jgi:PII-like signaling protein